MPKNKRDMIKNMQQQSKNFMYLVYDENLNFGAGKIDFLNFKTPLWVCIHTKVTKIKQECTVGVINGLSIKSILGSFAAGGKLSD